MCWKQYLRRASSQTNTQITAVQEVTENNLNIQGETSDNLQIIVMMYIFSGSTIVLSILLLTFNGISSHPIGERSAMTPAPEPIMIQSITHPPNECTPARQAERDNTHDIACLLDVFESYTSSQPQSVSSSHVVASALYYVSAKSLKLLIHSDNECMHVCMI